MAFNVQTFKTRTLTAVLFAAVMLTGLLWNFWSFLILFTVIHFGCWFELVKLMKKINTPQYVLYSLVGLVYITAPVLMFIDTYHFIDILIYNSSNIVAKGFFPVLIIASIWINDTMAYLVGSFIGKTPLSKISPKKTVEGTLGGIVLAVAVIGLSVQLIFESHKLTHASMLVAAICAIFGTVGDLFESKLKRMAIVKDSGSFMPGHGGFLDRFDSLLFAAPAVWIYLYFFLS